jgi:hypothetical protein
MVRVKDDKGNMIQRYLKDIKKIDKAVEKDLYDPDPGNDATCHICGLPGNLIQCDGCTQSTCRDCEYWPVLPDRYFCTDCKDSDYKIMELNGKKFVKDEEGEGILVQATTISGESILITQAMEENLLQKDPSIRGNQLVRNRRRA